MAITSGITQPPYQEQTFVIAAGARVDYFAVFNYFRPISITGGSLAVKFGDNGLESNYTGVGIGLDLQDTYSRVTLINNGASQMTITVALANGKITDDRLTVSGSVNVAPIGAVTTPTTADVAIAATTTTLVKAANANRREIMISNLLANGTVVRVGDASTGAARGMEIPVGGTAILSSAAAIYVYNPSAAGINIGVTELI